MVIRALIQLIIVVNLTDIMSQAVLATVNINIGLGRDNPTLIIREGDHVPTLVNKLIENYQLPKKVYAIIMERVAQQLPPIQPQIHNHYFLKTSPIEKQTPIPQAKSYNPTTPKSNQSRQGALGKENSKNMSNIITNNSKNMTKKSLSPLSNVSNTPKVKKIEIKPSKSPVKSSFNSVRQPPKQAKQADNTCRIQKLFKHLIKCNPSNVKVLSPEFINLKGLDRVLLSQLQDFFTGLEQYQFDLMTEPYFLARVEQLGFKKRFNKKEYDYCLFE